ncbi:MAG TPA: HemK/PrmC family methyltransferase, partial [Acidimicrobiales bacterium]|nr:HemK/PrmC family methyltransferase [Acidimicrobiales bacterium]
DEDFLVADLGTGSGAIALSIAAELNGEIRKLIVRATDVADTPIEVASRNLECVGNLANVEFFKGSWYEALPKGEKGLYRLIVSNPPYLSAQELDEVEPVVRDWEPHGALVAGPTGMEDIEVLVRGAEEWLCPGGALILELAPSQSTLATKLAIESGLEHSRIVKDLNGLDRILVAKR